MLATFFSYKWKKKPNNLKCGLGFSVIYFSNRPKNEDFLVFETVSGITLY